MIVAGSGLKVVVATRPVDFRKGHDGLVAVVEHELGLDAYSGVVFVFRPKRADRIKVLWWDGTDWCSHRSVWSRAGLLGRRFATG